LDANSIDFLTVSLVLIGGKLAIVLICQNKAKFAVPMCSSSVLQPNPCQQMHVFTPRATSQILFSLLDFQEPMARLRLLAGNRNIVAAVFHHTSITCPLIGQEISTSWSYSRPSPASSGDSSLNPTRSSCRQPHWPPAYLSCPCLPRDRCSDLRPSPASARGIAPSCP